MLRGGIISGEFYIYGVLGIEIVSFFKLYALNLSYSFKMLDSKTSSQLITAFTETKHNMDLNADKKRFTDFQEVLKSRAQKLKGTAKED